MRQLLHPITTLDYLKFLEDQKIKSLGTGSNGDVFQHPTMPNVAVKVTTNSDFSLDWYRWCLVHRNKYAPVVYHMEARPMMDRGVVHDFHFVFMERLFPTTRKRINQFLTKHGIPLTAWSTNSYMRRARLNVPPDVFKKLKDNQLREALTIIHGLSVGDSDLIVENIMTRNGKELVFVDPI